MGLLSGSARGLAAEIAAGERAATDCVGAAIARIEAVNRELNAVVCKRYEAAREEARDVDRRRARGEPLGPLAGVPIAVKECLDVVGTPSTFGLPARRGHRAERDDDVVASLRRAGAIVVAKTNVSQVLMFTESDNPLYGRTQNPWDHDRTPGGSSGGQSALLATGAVSLGLGTDIGGSVRVPAAFTGTTSLKPTAGRLPDPGRFSAPFGQRAVASQIGPMGRTVDDVALALAVANGDGTRADGAPRPLGDDSSVDVSSLRVGWYVEDGTFVVSPAIARAVRDAVGALAAAGAAVSELRPPDVPLAERLYFGIMAADGLAGLARTLRGNPLDLRIRMMLLGASRGPAATRWLARALRVSGRARQASIVACYGHGSADHYFELVARRDEYEREFAAACDALGPLDVIVCPPFALPALRHGATRELVLPGAYSSLYNLLGWPAGVVPVTRVRAGEEHAERDLGEVAHRVARDTERGSAGLPIGVQVVARPWRDHVALAAMRAIERAALASGEHPGAPAD